MSATRWWLVFMLAALVAMPLAATAQDDSGEPEVLSGDELSELFGQMSVEDLQRLIDEANLRRLELERDQVIAELRQGLLYDPKQIDQAVALLQQTPPTDRVEHIQRIGRALTIVDDRFAAARAHLTARQPAKAAGALEDLIEANDTSSSTAVKLLLLGDALRAAGKNESAAEAYRRVLTTMPERISFAAAAAIRAAETFEQAGRFQYARQMYDYAVTNYGLALTDEEMDWLADRATALGAVTDEPMAFLSATMTQAHARLAATDSGAETQALQEEAVTVLADLIKTIEEQASQQQGDSQSSEDRQKRPAGQQGEDGRQGQTGGRQASGPMEDSRIVPGQLPAVVRLTRVHDTAEDGDWATLPPLEREKIEQIMRQKMSRRYSRLVSDYHKRLAETEGNE